VGTCRMQEGRGDGGEMGFANAKGPGLQMGPRKVAGETWEKLERETGAQLDQRGKTFNRKRRVGQAATLTWSENHEKRKGKSRPSVGDSHPYHGIKKVPEYGMRLPVEIPEKAHKIRIEQRSMGGTIGKVKLPNGHKL